MKNDQHSRKIFVLLWLLVSLAVITGFVINVLIGNAISSQHSVNEQTHERGERLLSKVNEARVLFRSANADVLNVLDTDIYFTAGIELKDHSRLLESIQWIEEVILESSHDDLMVLDILIENLLEITEEATSWRYRYDELAIDLSQETTLKKVQNNLLQIRVKVISVIDEQRIKSALIIKRYRDSDGDTADELAHLIAEEHEQYAKGDLSQILTQISNLETLVEVMTNERHYDSLAGLKDNELYPSLVKLQTDVESFSKERGVEPLISNELLNTLKTVIYGERYIVDSSNVTVITGIGGLYNLHRNHFELQMKNAEIQHSLSELMNSFESESDIFTASMQQEGNVMTRGLDQRLTETWMNALFFSIFATLLFLFVAFQIFKVVGKQLERLVVLKQESEAASKAKSQFLATMSHEIRTPMNGMLGMAELLSFGDLSTKQRHYVTRIQQSGQQLLSLINQVLDFSKVEAGGLLLEAHDFNVDDILFEISELMQKQIQDKNIKLTMNIREPNILVNGDSNRLRQVLLNIIGNSIKFTTDGEIVVNLHTTTHVNKDIALNFSISDTGVGIQPDALDRVFELFSQADSSTTRKFGGSGLGLSICKQLIELMDGNISIQSEFGIGTTLSFSVIFKACSVKNVEPAVHS